MAENELLTPSEVAVLFRVNPKTVTRWARAGKISAVRTLGGHRRFRAGSGRFQRDCRAEADAGIAADGRSRPGVSKHRLRFAVRADGR